MFNSIERCSKVPVAPTRLRTVPCQDSAPISILRTLNGAFSCVLGRGESVMSGGSKTASKKRCACGRSQRFPLCDGNHSSEGWTCSTLDSLPVQRAFLAGPHLVNLAERLAHGMGGVAVGERHDMVRAVELVVLRMGPMSPGYAPVWRPLMPPEHRLLASASSPVSSGGPSRIRSVCCA